MHNYRTKASLGTKTRLVRPLVILIIFGFGIATLVGLNRSLIMRLVAKNPVVFHYALKGRAMLARLGWDYKSAAGAPSEMHPLPDTITIVVDLAQSKGRYQQFWGGFGYNSFSAGSLDANNQRLFEMMVATNRKNPGTFNYVRAFNIFTNGTAVTSFGRGCEIYSEDAMGNPQYHWELCDRVFDAMVSLGFDILVDFTLMPIELASNKIRIQPWFGGNMSPPLSHEKWANLVYETTKHLVERYGRDRVSRWYFEVWNEPDLAWLFWVPDLDNPDPRLREWGDMEAYNKLYDYTVAAVKRVDNQLRVGGPAVAGSYIEPFLRHLERTNYATGSQGTPVDFLSFHSYGSVFEKVINKIDEIHRTAGHIKKAYQNLPYIVSEFSPSPYDPAWYVNQYPALWLMATVDAIFHYADQCQWPDALPQMMIYWTSPVIQDFGQNGINKETDGLATTLAGAVFKLPIFNSFEMLGYLSDERVAVINSVPFPDYRKNLGTEYSNLLNAIATKSDSSFEVLLYQFTENDPFNRHARNYAVALTIQHIPDQNYAVKTFRLGENYANCYQAWRDLDSPLTPTSRELAILDQSDDLGLIEPAYCPRITAGNFRAQFELRSNEALLLVFSRQWDQIAPNAPARLLNTKVSTHSVFMQWQASAPAKDGDSASGYEIYLNQQLIARTFQPEFSREGLQDDTRYHFQIYALDDAGNLSAEPLDWWVTTAADNRPPALVTITFASPTSLTLEFDEPVDTTSALQPDNYQIEPEIAIHSVIGDPSGRKLTITTSPHQLGHSYTMVLRRLSDRARRPNRLADVQIPYQFVLKFEDQFDFDNLNSYIWHRLWDEGGIGSYRYDAEAKRLLMTTGDDVGEGFGRALPMSEQGTFQIDFYPIESYPSGGRMILKLKQDQDNYYQLEKTQGYGPGYLKKVIAGVTVDSVSCHKEYRQGQNYHLQVTFAPNRLSSSGFNETITLENHHEPIKVQWFEIQLWQQDAYFDNILYESR